MSNANLKAHLKQRCDEYRAGKLALEELARQVNIHAEAFENIEFKLVQRLRSLAHELEVSAYLADEDCQTELEPQRLLADLDSVMSHIPD